MIASADLKAADGLWTVDANGNWSAPANWVGSTIADGAGSVVTFSLINLTGADRTVSLDGTRTVGVLRLGDNNTGDRRSYILTATAGSSLILDNGASNAVISTISTSNGDTINAPILLNSSLDIYQNANDKTLTLGAITGNTAGLKTITLGGFSPQAWSTNPLSSNISTGAVSFTGVIADGTGQIALLIDSHTGSTATLSGANTFTGGVTLSNGILALNHNSALGTGGAFTIQGGMLTSASSNTVGIGNAVFLNGSFSTLSTLTLGNATTTITMAQDITLSTLGGQFNMHGTVVDGVSDHQIIKTGVGTLYMSNSANSYSGGTVVEYGKFVIGNTASLGTGNVLIKNGASFTMVTAVVNQALLNRVDTASLGAFGAWGGSGAGALDFSNHAGLVFGSASGNYTYTGALTPFGNVYRFGGTSGTSITLDVALTDNGGTARSLEAGVKGSNYGNVILSKANTYTGSTTLFGPTTLQLNGNQGRIADTSDINIRGNATFRYDNTGVTAGTAIGETVGNLNLQVGDATVLSQRAVDANTTLTFGAINRSAGATANFTIGGTNATFELNRVTFTAAPAADQFLDQGLFAGGANYAAYDSAGYIRALAYGTDMDAVNVAGGAVMTGAAAKHVSLSGAITNQTTVTIHTLRLPSTSGVTLASGATLTIDNGGILKTGASTATISGGAGITTGGNTELVIRVDASGDTLTIGSNILASSTGGLTKSGAGLLVLSGNNTYGGTTTVNGGTLRALGTTALSTGNIVLQGGTLDLRANATSPGNNNVTPETLVFGNHLFVEGDSTLAVNNMAGTGIFTNKVLQLGNLTIGGNTLAISNNNGYGVEFAGTTTLSPGVMGNTTFATGSARPSNLTASLTLSGKVTGSSHITMTGNGTLQLKNASNDFVGDITVTGGVLAVSSDTALGNTANKIRFLDATSSSAFRALDTFATSRTFQLGNNLATRNIFHVVSGKTFTLNSAFSGQGGFAKYDNGTFEINADNSSWNGDILIHDGVLKVSHSAALGSTVGTTQVNNQESALHLSGGITTGENLILLSSGVNSTGALFSASGVNVHTGAITLTGDASIGVAAGSELSINGATPIGFNSYSISDPRAAAQFDLTLTGAGTGFMNSVIDIGESMLIKQGDGTWTLTAANTFTREVYVYDGTLVLSGANGSLATVTTASNGVLRVGSGASLVLDNTSGHRDNRLGGRGVYLGGSLSIIGDASAATVETISGSNLWTGNVASVLTLDAHASQSLTLQITSTGNTFVRNGQGTVLFRGDNLGNAPGAGVATMKAVTAPTFVGQTGTDNTLNKGILSWALVDQSTTGLGQGFATYDAANGIRLLNDTEQVSYIHGSINAELNPISNLTLSDVKGALGRYTVNSLTLKDGGGVNIETLTTLVLDSGGLLAFSGNTGVHGGILTTSSNREMIAHVLGDLEITSVIQGTSGGLTKTGNGVLTLSSANYYTGATTVSQGTLLLNGGDHTILAGQTLNVNAGGALDLNGTTQMVGVFRSLGSPAGEAPENGGLVTTTGGAATLVANMSGGGTFAGTITGDITFIRSHTNVLNLTSLNHYTGDTVLNGGITILRDAGKITSSSSLALEYGGLILANYGSTDDADRLGDDIDIKMNGGTLSLYGRGGAMSSETVGDVNLVSGLNIITAAAGSNNGNLMPQSATLTLSSLTRDVANGATVNFGQSYSGTSSERLGIIASGAGSSENILVAGGSATTNNIVGPWAIYTNYFNTNALEFVGYDEAGGVGALNATGFAGYDATTMPTGNQATQNVRITAAATVASGGVTINTLNIVSNTTTNSVGVSFTNTTDILNLAGGAIAVSQDASITSTPRIGSVINEGRITAGGQAPTGPVDLFVYYQNNSTTNALSINSAVVDNPNNGGQPLRLILNGSVFGRYLINLASTQNSYTGGTVINAAAVQVSGNLGTGGIVLNGGSLTQLAGGVIGVQSLTLKGPSQVVLNGTNTLSQITIENSGGSLPTSSNGTTNLGAPSIDVGSGGTLNLNGNISVTSSNVATMALISNGTLNLNGATRTVNVDAITYDGELLSPTQSALQISSVIAGNTGNGLVKTGDGFLYLSGANTFTGGFVLQEGGVVIGNNTALGTVGSTLQIHAGTTITADGSGRSLANAVLVNGDFTMGVRGPTVPGGLTLSGVITWGSTKRAVTVNSAPTTTQTLSGVINGSGGIVKRGIGTLAITANNSLGLNWRAAESVVVEEGTLSINSDNALGGIPTIPTARNIVLNGGALAASATLTININRGIALGHATGSGTGILDVAGSANVLTYGGVITDNGTGADHLLKTGAGTVLLDGINTYTGNTTIGAGTLSLGSSGSIYNSKLITVVTGATYNVSGVLGGYVLTGGQTLEGNGRVVGIVYTMPGSFIAPGTGVNHTAEKLTFANDLHVNSGTIVDLDITTATFTSTNNFDNKQIGSAEYLDYIAANAAGQQEHDLLNITGELYQYDGAQFRVTGQNFTPVYGQIFNLVDWGVAFYTSTNLGLEDNYRDGSSDSIYDLDLPDISSSGLLWDISSFSTYGVIVVVPEPSRFLLVLIAGASLLWVRRRPSAA